MRTSSYFRTFFLAPKLLPSTLFWVLSTNDTLALLGIFSLNLLIRSSSIEQKNLVVPLSPCLPARPLSWSSTLFDSYLSVPITYRPPSSRTCSFSVSHRDLVIALTSSMNAGFPPSRISVPLPAILVDTVTAFSLPAWAIILASSLWFFAFSTLCAIPMLSSITDRASECFTEAVPMRIGLPVAWTFLISSQIASHFSSSVSNTSSMRSILATGLWVGIDTTFML